MGKGGWSGGWERNVSREKREQDHREKGRRLEKARAKDKREEERVVRLEDGRFVVNELERTKLREKKSNMPFMYRCCTMYLPVILC